MKNIFVLYTERSNSPFDVFTIPDLAFEIMFPNGIDVTTCIEAGRRIDEFIPEVPYSQRDQNLDYQDDKKMFLNKAFDFEYRRIPLSQAKGIHATLYMDLDLSTLPSDRIEDKIDFENKTMSMFVYDGIYEYRDLPYYDPKINGMEGMKNFLYIDTGTPCYWFEMYAVTNSEFEMLFGDTDIAVEYELYQRVEKLVPPESYDDTMKKVWSRRVPKSLAINGIHAIVLDVSLENCIKYYPTRKIEEAINPDGSALRRYGATSKNKTAILPYQYIDFDEDDPNLTYEQINDLWDEAIEKIKQNIGYSRQEDIVVKYSLITEENESDDDKINKYFSKAYNAHNKDDYGEAIIWYSKMIDLNYSHDLLYYAFYNRGVINAKLFHDNLAIEDFTQAIQLQPEDSESYMNRGKALYRLKNYHDAIKDYSAVIKLKPEEWQAFYWRAYVEDELKLFDLAIKDYDEAIRLKPNDENIYFNKSCVYTKIKNKLDALRWLEEAVKLGFPINEVQDDEDWQEYINDSDFKTLIAKYTNL